MKKILIVALALLVSGTMYADKKCCKDKASCSKKEASCAGKEAKACDHASAKDGAKAEASHAGCSHAAASSGKACCAKGTKAAQPQDSKTMRDDAVPAPTK